jgi:hypothetical protein
MLYSTFDKRTFCCFFCRQTLFPGRSFFHTFHRPQAISFSNFQVKDTFLFPPAAPTRLLPGHHNVVADTLSRSSQPSATILPATPSTATVSPAVSTNLFPLHLSYTDIAKAQLTCPPIHPCPAQPAFLAHHFHTIFITQLSILGDVSTKTFCPLIPAQFQPQIFNHIHSIGHPGIRATRCLISMHFVWSHMARDITEWTRQCIACQKAKIHTHVSPQPLPISIPNCHFSHIYVDLVGPLPPSQGFTHILTIVDRTTCWTEAVPLTTTTATGPQPVQRLFVLHGYADLAFLTLSLLSVAPKFTSSLWSQLTAFLHVSHITTTAFHPQSNGMVEQGPLFLTCPPPLVSPVFSFLPHEQSNS